MAGREIEEADTERNDLRTVLCAVQVSSRAQIAPKKSQSHLVCAIAKGVGARFDLSHHAKRAAQRGQIPFWRLHSIQREVQYVLPSYHLCSTSIFIV